MRKVDISDIYNMQLMVHRRASEVGLTVTFDPMIDTAMTSKNRIILPAPKLPMTKEEYDLTYGYMVHETGHHTRPRSFEIGEQSGLTMGHPILHLFNYTEDQGMEASVAKKYLGDRKALGKLMAGHIKKQMATFKDYPDEYWDWEDQIKSSAAYMVMLYSRDWDDYIQGPMLDLESSFNDKTRKLTLELIEEGWHERVQKTETPDDTWDLAIDLYKRLYPEADEDRCEKIREQGHNSLSDEGSSEESSEGGKGEGEGEESEGTGEADYGEGMPGVPEDYKSKKADVETDDGDESERPDEVEDYTKYPWQRWLHSDHDGKNQKGLPAVIQWEGREHGNQLVLLDKDRIKVVDCPYKGENKFNIDSTNAASLANAIRIYIQAKSRTKFTPEQTRGKIDKRGVVRLGFPPLDGGEWNRKIFYTKTNKVYKNTAVAIHTDWSGSMWGRKKEVAVRATAKLAEVFDKQLRVPTMITAFSGRPGTCAIGKIKEFHTKTINPDVIGTAFSHFDEHTSGNADADSILWVYNKLMERKEERKILIVLSDGAPTDCHPEANPDDMLIHVCKSLESKKNLDLIGIGILSDCVKRYYKNYRIIENVSDLDTELLSVLKEVYTNDDPH